MKQELHVLIIEDDFRVAEINRQLVEQVAGYQVDGIAKTGDEAMDFLANSHELPDLILLDVFIPDRMELDMLWEIRSNFHPIDIIMLTAAKEAATIEEALRCGIFDYLIKPVDFSRFEQSLLRFSEQKAFLASRQNLEQTDIDRLIGIEPIALLSDTTGELPKGIDQLTLVGIMEILQSSAPAGINAMETGRSVGVSRSTARRYLEHLVSTGEAKAQLNYGEIGRPERRYIPWTK